MPERITLLLRVSLTIILRKTCARARSALYSGSPKRICQECAETEQELLSCQKIAAEIPLLVKGAAYKTQAYHGAVSNPCEMILRRLHDPTYKSPGSGKGSENGTPSMMLTLKNGDNSTNLDVSTILEDTLTWFQGKESSLFANDFGLHRLTVGQGIAFVNSGEEKENELNMHFLAVITYKNGDVVLSDISEKPGKEENVNLRGNTVTARTIGELREKLGSPYTEDRFKAGKVWLDLGSAPAEMELDPETRS